MKELLRVSILDSVSNMFICLIISEKSVACSMISELIWMNTGREFCLLGST